MSKVTSSKRIREDMNDIIAGISKQTYPPETGGSSTSGTVAATDPKSKLQKASKSDTPTDRKMRGVKGQHSFKVAPIPSKPVTEKDDHEIQQWQMKTNFQVRSSQNQGGPEAKVRLRQEASIDHPNRALQDPFYGYQASTAGNPPYHQSSKQFPPPAYAPQASAYASQPSPYARQSSGFPSQSSAYFSQSSAYLSSTSGDPQRAAVDMQQVTTSMGAATIRSRDDRETDPEPPRKKPTRGERRR